MYPKLINSLGTTLAVFNNVSASSITQTSDGVYTYDLTIKKDGKDLNVIKGTKLSVNGQEFNVIRKINSLNQSGEQSVTLRSEHVLYDGNDYTFDTFAFTGTAEEILTQLISVTGADFTVGTIQTTGSIIFIRNEKTTFLQAVRLLAAAASLEVEYDNKIVNMPTQIGSNNGVRFQAGRNLKGITYDEDYLTDTVSIAVDVVEVSKTEEFKTGKIKLPDNVSLGDIVGVYTDEISETTRVVQIKYDPIEGENQGYVLSNQIETFTKNNTNQKFSTVLKGRPVYGVDINNDDGFTVERTDLLAKAILNADELRFQLGDGVGNYTDALYFDILNLQYKFIGDLDATGTITGGHIIGGDIIIGTGDSVFKADTNGIYLGNDVFASAPFSVSVDGDLIATSATIEGSISSSTITGTDITGGTISGSIFRSSLTPTSERVEIQAAGAIIRGYNSSNQLVSSIDMNVGVGSIGMKILNTRDNMDIVSLNDMYIGATNGELAGTWIYDGSEIANRSYVTSRGYITGTSGFSGTVSPVNSITVSNGLVTSAS